MAYENSPSAVMYADLKELGLKKNGVAMILLDTTRSFGGSLLVDRIQSRSQLTRYIVQTAPGDISPNLFKDFGLSAPIIFSRLVDKLTASGKSHDEARCFIGNRYSGASAEAMQRALADYGLDENVYRNALMRISQMDLNTVSERSFLYLLLFIVTGCTGDPHRSVWEVERAVASSAKEAFQTVIVNRADYLDSSELDKTDASLGVIRIVDGMMKGSLYELATDNEGTEIGAFAHGANPITDVDRDVSRRHVRIYKEGEKWYVVGLDSTNGTRIISSNGKETVVEPPRKSRLKNYAPQPIELHVSDILCLGFSTQYLVVPLITGQG